MSCGSGIALVVKRIGSEEISPRFKIMVIEKTKLMIIISSYVLIELL